MYPAADRSEHPLAEPAGSVLDAPRADVTLVGSLRRAARSTRGIVLVGAEDRERRRTYAQILAGAERRAAALLRQGLSPGQPVVVVLDTSFELVETLYGVLLAGGIPTPAYPPVAMARLQGYVRLLRHVVDATRAAFLVTDARTHRALGELRRAPTLKGLLQVETLDADPVGLPLREPGFEDTALIQCTSGSTSAPKPVQLLHANLRANIVGMERRIAWDGDRDVTVSWAPLYHDLGLIGALFGAVNVAGELVLLSPATFLMDAGAWWRAMDRHRGTITAAPNFAYALSVRRMSQEEIAALDLGAARVLLSGAEPIRPDTMDGFFAAFAPARLDPRSILPAYGLAESCVAVTSVPAGHGLRTERLLRSALVRSHDPRAVVVCTADGGWADPRETGVRPKAAAEPQGEAARGDASGFVETVCCGPPIAGTEVSVRDPHGLERPERGIGEIFVRGPSVMAGYLGQPEETAEVLRDGWLRTGDLGYLADGDLYIVGRLKHVLIIRGRNYCAEPIVAAVDAVEGVRAGSAVAFGVYDERRKSDRLFVALETRWRGKEDLATLERAVAEAVREEVGIDPARIFLLPPNALPKTSSGKRQPARVRQMMLSGALERPASTSRRALAGVMALVRSQVAHAAAGLDRTS